MKFPIKSKSKLIVQYPELAEYDEFLGDDTRLRFVILLLDDADKENDIKRRVSKAARQANLRISKPLEDKEVTKMMIRYFIIQNNHAFELWLSKIISFGEANFQIRQSVDNAKDQIKAMELKLKVGVYTDALLLEILKLERTLFKDPLVEKKIKESLAGRVVHYAELYAEPPTTLI